ncbi:hypothetical protein MMC10_006958 [Thelotrema lepadinum]|nr:hypothetical protein [Thelotrema lepadinum]
MTRNRNRNNGNNNRVGKLQNSSATTRHNNSRSMGTDMLLRRLQVPLESREEEYRHTLIAKHTVGISRKTDPSSGFPYKMQERSAKLNANLKQALSSHLKVNNVDLTYKGKVINLSHEAHVYFLEHSKFVVRQTAHAEALVEIIDSLKNAGYPARVSHLCVRTPMPQEMWDEGYDSDGRPGPSINANKSYGPGDHHLPGPQYYRILKPLLGLRPPPQNLTIITDVAAGTPDLAGPGNPHFRIGMEYVAAEVTKLKDLVLEGSDSAKFAVFDLPGWGGKKSDSAWLFEAPNEEEKAQMNQYLADRQELDNVNRRFEGVKGFLNPREASSGTRRLIKQVDASRSRASLTEEQRSLEAKLTEISLRVKPFFMDDKLLKLLNRFRVYELAMDPEWEAKAGSEATESYAYGAGSMEDELFEDYMRGLARRWREEKAASNANVSTSNADSSLNNADVNNNADDNNNNANDGENRTDDGEDRIDDGEDDTDDSEDIDEDDSEDEDMDDDSDNNAYDSDDSAYLDRSPPAF